MCLGKRQSRTQTSSEFQLSFKFKIMILPVHYLNMPFQTGVWNSTAYSPRSWTRYRAPKISTRERMNPFLEGQYVITSNVSSPENWIDPWQLSMNHSGDLLKVESIQYMRNKFFGLLVYASNAPSQTTRHTVFNLEITTHEASNPTFVGFQVHSRKINVIC